MAGDEKRDTPTKHGKSKLKDIKSRRSKVVQFHVEINVTDVMM